MEYAILFCYWLTSACTHACECECVCMCVSVHRITWEVVERLGRNFPGLRHFENETSLLILSTPTKGNRPSWESNYGHHTYNRIFRPRVAKFGTKINLGITRRGSWASEFWGPRPPLDLEHQIWVESQLYSCVTHKLMLSMISNFINSIQSTKLFC